MQLPVFFNAIDPVTATTTSCETIARVCLVTRFISIQSGKVTPAWTCHRRASGALAAVNMTGQVGSVWSRHLNKPC